MNPITKFRAYLIKDNCWLKEFTVSADGTYVFTSKGLKVGEDVILEQTRGQKDTMGQRIFEGDIVQFLIDEYAQEQHPSIHTTGTSQVYFNHGSFLIDVWGDGYVPYHFPFGNYPQTQIRVLGNIHDNPEGLKDIPKPPTLREQYEKLLATAIEVKELNQPEFMVHLNKELAKHRRFFESLETEEKEKEK